MNLPLTCQICHQKAHGKHFGVVSCRPCSAFFRRAVLQGKTREKCPEANCANFKNGKFRCKICRLNRCFDAGMTSEKFQFDRDPDFYSTSTGLMLYNRAAVPKSMETFLGRPASMISFEPDKSASVITTIDLSTLLDNAENLLIHGVHQPYTAKNSLEKMSLNSENIRRKTHQMKFQKLRVFGRSECTASWERDFMMVVEWFTHFDEFRELSLNIQMKTIKLVWVLWAKLDKLAKTAELRRKKMLEKNCFYFTDDVCVDIAKYDVDVSWFTNYSEQQLRTFYESNYEQILGNVLQWMMDLNPSDVELNFMFCQLCLQYAGNTLRGDIATTFEKIMEKQSNELHEYYHNTMKMPNYLARLAKMMKINNCIVEYMRNKSEKNEIARIFDVYTINFSHPGIIEGWS